MLVKQTSEKWLYAEKGEESGWVPQNHVCILTDIISEKKTKKDYHVDEINSLSFSRGDKVKIFKEKLGWGIGSQGESMVSFP